jgi:hypothetical protein
MRKIIKPPSVRPSLPPLGFRSDLRGQTYLVGSHFHKLIVLNSIALEERATQAGYPMKTSLNGFFERIVPFEG